MKRSLRNLAAGLATASMLSGAALLLTPAVAHADGCPAVQTVGIGGAGDPNADVWTSQDASTIPIRYEASVIPGIAPLGGATDYNTSVDHGATTTVNVVHDIHANCPGTRIEIKGYSLGGAVGAEATRRLAQEGQVPADKVSFQGYGEPTQPGGAGDWVPPLPGIDVQTIPGEQFGPYRWHRYALNGDSVSQDQGNIVANVAGYLLVHSQYGDWMRATDGDTSVGTTFAGPGFPGGRMNAAAPAAAPVAAPAPAPAPTPAAAPVAAAPAAAAPAPVQENIDEAISDVQSGDFGGAVEAAGQALAEFTQPAAAPAPVEVPEPEYVAPAAAPAAPAPTYTAPPAPIWVPEQNVEQFDAAAQQAADVANQVSQQAQQLLPPQAAAQVDSFLGGLLPQ